MGQMQGIDRSKEPIRLFKSDFLEFFTHIRPGVVAGIWGPVTLYFLVRGVVDWPRAVSPGYIVLTFVIGLFLWTFAEYTLHRFLFHFRPRTPWQARVSFLMHGVHHAQPMEKTRLVMPPPVSAIMALIFYGLFYLIVAVGVGAPYAVGVLFSGFVGGYLAYDMTHYSLHHINLRGKYLQFLRRHHMRHHTQLPMLRFGVSSPLWDYVFGTEPKE
jgi:sterol desaturase/sphingolipid hydroxylase (fatty acid hydroxylase superfamily)